MISRPTNLWIYLKRKIFRERFVPSKELLTIPRFGFDFWQEMFLYRKSWHYFQVNLGLLQLFVWLKYWKLPEVFFLYPPTSKLAKSLHFIVCPHYMKENTQSSNYQVVADKSAWNYASFWYPKWLHQWKMAFTSDLNKNAQKAKCN